MIKASYTDFRGEEIKVLFFKPFNKTVDDYFDRIFDDKATLEATTCVRTGYADLEGVDYDFECLDSNPVEITLGDNVSNISDRYASLKPSFAYINLVVKDDTERDIVNQISAGPYYVNIYKDGDLYFIGKVEKRYINAPMLTYPYTVKIMANDAIRDFNKSQPIMDDFPEPYYSSQPTLIKFICTLLSDEYTKPLATLPTSPDVINVYSRIKLLGDEIWEDTTLNPLAFMKDNKDEYEDKNKILSNVLDIFNLTLMQWKGEWYLMSRDALFDDGQVELRQYNVTSGTYVGDITTPRNVIDFTECDTDYKIGEDAEVGYYQSLIGIESEVKYQKANALKNFTNRLGNFYYGNDNNLEMLKAYSGGKHNINLDRFSDAINTSDNIGTVEEDAYNRTGNLYFTANDASHLNETLYLKTTIMESDDFPDRFVFKLGSIGVGDQNSTSDTYFPTIKVEVSYHYEVSLGTYSTVYVNTSNAWTSSQTYLYIDSDKGMELDMPSTLSGHKFWVQMKVMIQGTPLIGSTIMYAYLNNASIALEYTDWNDASYKQTLKTFISYYGDTVLKKDFIWGFSYEDLSNSYTTHYSAIYDTSTDPITDFYMHKGNPQAKRQQPWLWTMEFIAREANTSLKRIKTSLYVDKDATDITPFTLFKDDTDTLLTIERMSYLREKEKVDLVEAKFITLDGETGACDFSTTDFNDDFCL